MRKADRRLVRCDAAPSSSANPLLVYVAVMLFTILAIIEIDLHRDLLGQIGIVISHESIDARLAGP